jgi:hypothetical protein
MTFRSKTICAECGNEITETYQPEEDWTMEAYLKLPWGVDICSKKCLISFLGN